MAQLTLTINNRADAPHIESQLIEASSNVEGQPSAWVTWYEPDATAGPYTIGAKITVSIAPTT